MTLFNRLPLSEEIYNLIGDFTNIGAIAYRQQKDFWQEVNFVQKQLWELVRYHSFDGTQILKMIDPMNRGKAILPVVFTGVLQGDRKTKGFLPNGVSEGYAISQTPQVVLDYQATDFNGELLVNWDYVIDNKFSYRFQRLLSYSLIYTKPILCYPVQHVAQLSFVAY